MTDLYPGQRVVKPKGYEFPGVVLGLFQTIAGETRVVVESTTLPGLLHIYAPHQLEAAPELPTEAAPALEVERPACIECGHGFDAHSERGCGHPGADTVVCTCHRRPLYGRLIRPRILACVEAWPEAETGEYDPRCCRFPKSCSADVYGDQQATPELLEPPRG